MADEKTAPPPPNAEEPAPDPHEGPGKGKAFFDRARSVAATGNYDYAIDMYIEGLFREPFNVDEHKALRDVAMHRKIKGGKAAGGLLGGFGGPKAKYKGKSPKETLLNNEFTLARDVGNIPAMQAILRNASELKLKDVVLWIGSLLKEANKTSKTPKVEAFTELAAIYAEHGEFERACDAINDACKLKPNDPDLPGLAQQYAAQATLKRGKYDQGASFKDSIKDAEHTKKLLEEDNLGKSEAYLMQAVKEAEAEYLKNPMELQVIIKYYKALAETDKEEYENKAIALLQKAYVDTKIYRLKAQVGDIRIKQFKRNLRVLAEATKANPQDKDLLKQLHDLEKERLAFELSEFKERAEFMPSDLIVKYELGVRLYYSKLYDEAIPAFQEARSNPKVRVEALYSLGRCFLHQHMKPEAVETFKNSIEGYDLRDTGNTRSKELHYWYARALEENTQWAEAIAVYSKVVQWDIKFLDARERMTKLREQLEKEGPKPGQ